VVHQALGNHEKHCKGDVKPEAASGGVDRWARGPLVHPGAWAWTQQGGLDKRRWPRWRQGGFRGSGGGREDPKRLAHIFGHSRPLRPVPSIL